MRIKVAKILSRMVVALSIAMSVASCSTTKRLSIDDPLYTGVKGVEITSLGDEKLPSDVKSQIKEAVPKGQPILFRKPNRLLASSAKVSEQTCEALSHIATQCCVVLANE